MLYNAMVTSTLMQRCNDVDATLYKRHDCIYIDAALYKCYDVDATLYKRHNFASTLMQRCINVMMWMLSYINVITLHRR